MTKDEYIEVLIKNIEYACSIAKVTPNKLGIESGLGKDIVANLKKGSMLSADKLAEVANYLNVSVDYLLGRVGNPDEIKMPTGDYMIIGRDNNGTAMLNSSSQIALGEMEAELLKAFQSLSFTDKIDVLNYIINKGE